MKDNITGAIPKVMPTKVKITIPKEFHDRKIAEQSKYIMTNKEKLQEVEDLLIDGLEGLSHFTILKRRLELILLVKQIKAL